MKTGSIEELPTRPGVDVNTIDAVIESIPEEHGEVDAKECWCKCASLLYSAANSKSLRNGAIEENSAMNILVEGEEIKQIWWTCSPL